MILIQFENLRFTADVLSTPSDQAAEILKETAPRQNVEMLLKYQAAEQNRRYSYAWEEAQFGLALILGACLFLGTQRSVFPMVFCGLMLLLVVFEHFGVSQELAYSGREADFPPGNAATGALIHMYVFEQIYAWVEGTKLVLGGLLSGYLFIFRTRRSRKQMSTTYPQPSRMNG